MISVPYSVPKNIAIRNWFGSRPPSDIQNDHVFKILPLNELSDLELERIADPHRNENYQIIFIRSGTTICKIDMQSYNLSEKHIGYIYPGQIYQILPSTKADGFILSFTRDFFHLSVKRSLLGNQANLLGTKNSSQFLIDDFVKDDLHEIVTRIEKELSSARPLKYEVLKGLLRILLIHFSRISNGIMIGPSPDKNYKTVKNFFLMLEEKYRTNRMATDYSDALAVTTNFLNALLKKNTGFTTSYHIHQRILTEAKRLTVYSDITMKEIAYHLGFEDSAHFSKFFKKVAGESFKEFKKNIK